jgi:hypothetical protein
MDYRRVEAQPPPTWARSRMVAPATQRFDSAGLGRVHQLERFAEC